MATFRQPRNSAPPKWELLALAENHAGSATEYEHGYVIVSIGRICYMRENKKSKTGKADAFL